MTEALKQFIEQRAGEANSFDVSEADFWIRAFVTEVENRSKPDDLVSSREDVQDSLLAIAFSFCELKRELLGS